MGRLKDCPFFPWALVWAVLVSLLLGMAYAQKECDKTKCHECIQTPGCMWCSELKNSSYRHCLSTKIDDVASVCEEGFENPVNEKAILENLALTDTTTMESKSEENQAIVQLSPQKIKLKLRKGTAEKVELKYKPAEGYPIDLYYLMDLSKSMKDDKMKLSELGSSLTSTLQSLASDYNIGFGSFVDKLMMPFVDMHPKKKENPCIGCVKTYAFRNEMPLGSNGKLFTKKVREADISGNVDLPEGGFDALMQVMVCKEEIKWRDQARKLVIFSTDALFHQAGDGKLAGIVVPNDEKCHLNAKNEYDASGKFDYPSIGQLNKVSKENDIYIIFAVSNHEDVYAELSKLIDNSSCGKLSNDSANIVELVREQYSKMTSVVRLTDNATDDISIHYSSSCKNPKNQTVSTNQCKNIQQGDIIDFTLDIKLKSCPAGKDREIVEVKTLQDSLILEIEFLCDCSCETKGTSNQTDECKNNGTRTCGVCYCPERYYGNQCQCSTEGEEGEITEEGACKAEPTDLEACSSNGRCICGVCNCNEHWTGKYCECNEQKCQADLTDTSYCSGQGKCVCEECVCNEGFEGQHCQCRTKDACRNSTNEDEQLCSGHGKCVCGKCICDSTEKATYVGQYCADCSTCGHGKCSEFVEDVRCHFQDSNPGSCKLPAKIVDSLDDPLPQDTRLCTFVDEDDGCKILFTYRYVDANVQYEIHVLRDKECPEASPVLGIVLGIVGGIIFIGLLTLTLWRLFATIHDRREYAKFEKERQNAEWSDKNNPLYRAPKTDFVNPLFNQQQGASTSEESQ